MKTIRCIAETYCHRLWKGAWDAASAQWIGAQPWADVNAPPGPDGMAFGADGLLYVAVYRHGQIKAIGTAGEIVQTFDLPGNNPTNVAFDPSGGPAGKLGMVVTEAEKGLLLALPQAGAGARLFGGDDSAPFVVS